MISSAGWCLSLKHSQTLKTTAEQETRIPFAKANLQKQTNQNGLYKIGFSVCQRAAQVTVLNTSPHTESPNGRRICVRPRIWSVNGSVRLSESRSEKLIWHGCPHPLVPRWTVVRPHLQLDGANGTRNETSCFSPWSWLQGRGSANLSRCERQHHGALDCDLVCALTWRGQHRQPKHTNRLQSFKKRLLYMDFVYWENECRAVGKNWTQTVYPSPPTETQLSAKCLCYKTHLWTPTGSRAASQMAALTIYTASFGLMLSNQTLASCTKWKWNTKFPHHQYLALWCCPCMLI